LRAIGVDAVEVRTLEQLAGVDGLIIPGGESTTIARLLIAFDMLEPLRERIEDGLPVWGTCAGAIMLAKRVPALDRPPLGVMDITVDRNAFGRQIDSFEEDLEIAGVAGGPIHAVFIRAPVIREAGPQVQILAALRDGRIVACREGRLLATSFHPELTDDSRMHEAFVALVREAMDAPTDATASKNAHA
jgi:pyridoxal 5'-phosphate synthase pdxT subunit